MIKTRRDFLKFGAAAGAVGTLAACGQQGDNSTKKAGPLDHLTSMVTTASPISTEEHKGRVAKAQRLMAENGIDAMFLDGGTSLRYFTGITWGTSERMLAAIIPAVGEVKYVSPGFEEERMLQMMILGDEVRVWQEHESPYMVVAGILKDMGVDSGTIAMEERVRFFLYDGIRKVVPNATFVSADPVSIPSRMFKSPAEIALMQVANDVTIEAYRNSIPLLEVGMTPGDFTKVTADVFDRLGVPGGSLWCSFAEATAFPHGSREPQYLKEGDMVLMDGGCKVLGYGADISRTTVFGNPTARQTEIWNLEKAAQAAGFNAAILGDPCENVDIAARQVQIDAGFGPGYKVPGLPHRTGHGIGMDGHEWGNMVLGNKTPLQVGMCFSIEPMIAIYGEFGVRLEDCAHMTEDGVKWFSEPSESIMKPV